MLVSAMFWCSVLYWRAAAGELASTLVCCPEACATPMPLYISKIPAEFIKRRKIPLPVVFLSPGDGPKIITQFYVRYHTPRAHVDYASGPGMGRYYYPHESNRVHKASPVRGEQHCMATNSTPLGIGSSHPASRAAPARTGLIKTKGFRTAYT